MTDNHDPSIISLSEHVTEDPDAAAAAQGFLIIMERFYAQGIKQVSVAMMMRAAGMDEDEITEEHEKTSYELTEKYFKNRDTVMAVLENGQATRQ